MHSAELRWFLPVRNHEKELLDWFRLQGQLALNEEKGYEPSIKTGPFVKLELARTDKYLLLPGSDAVGVKQRQGKLEIKALVTGPRPVALGGVIGRTDQWVKWSFEPSNKQRSNDLEIELDIHAPWREVIKKRHLQKYSFDSGGPVAVSPDERPDLGCTVELTALDIKADIRIWLTLGFEAFGPSGQVMALLDEAVRHFFALHGAPPILLDGRDSLSYPAWLAMLR